jgi:hypothetical protein
VGTETTTYLRVIFTYLSTYLFRIKRAKFVINSFSKNGMTMILKPALKMKVLRCFRKRLKERGNGRSQWLKTRKEKRKARITYHKEIN